MAGKNHPNDVCGRLQDIDLGIISAISGLVPDFDLKWLVLSASSRRLRSIFKARQLAQYMGLQVKFSFFR